MTAMGGETAVAAVAASPQQCSPSLMAVAVLAAAMTPVRWWR